MIMSRNRKRTYLLLALLPTTLGVGTFAIVDQYGGVEEAQAPVTVPASINAPPMEVGAASMPLPSSPEASGAAPQVSAPAAPPVESKQPAASPDAVQTESDEAAAYSLYAGSGPTEHAGDSSAYGPVRLASIAALSGGSGGGGGGSRHSSGGKDSTPKDPQAGNGSEHGPGTHLPQPGAPDKPPGDSNNGSDGTGGGGTGGDGGPAQGPKDGAPKGDGPNEENPNQGGPYLPPVVDEPVQVPEPATLGLLALGLLGCAAGRKTRK